MKDITIENFLKNLKNALDTSQVEIMIYGKLIHVL